MENCEDFRDDSRIDAPVRGFLHRAAGAGIDCLVLTHGAGANCQSPLLMALADAFCAAGVTVLRCDLPFRQARPHGPPLRTAEKDQEGLRAAVEAIRRQTTGKIFLGGHSYGGRQASMLAARESELVERLLMLSYPLHPPKRPDQMRTAHFPSLLTPALFVSGERDGFGSKMEMEAALKLIPAKTELLMVAGAGHELMTPRNRADLPTLVVEAFLKFANG
ncbi:alpha/beta fold hydrolase [Telmatobacter sp. DSM 110680]|uniref:Alpha/beta fold hydrolase n=1 Tax=Telmatobacter sp. DSM 110680 TaxID=3036704 RepID=A0AAU7DHH5_9BACT